MKRSPALRRAVAFLLVAATVWYLAATIHSHWAELRDFDWRADPALLAASVVAHVLVLAWGVWVWSRVLRHFEHPPVRLGALQRIWFLSNLARYVPGKVFQFIAVAQLSRSAGLSGAVLLTSMLVHTGMSLLSAVVVASWTVTGGIFRGVDPLWPALALSAGAVLAVHPAFLNRLLSAIPRLLKRDVIRWNGGWGDGLVLLALSVVSWLLYGAAYHLFIASLIDVPWSLMPALTGVNALSFVFGYVSPLPGGAGLREVSMKMLLEPYMASGVAAVLAIAARLWTIAAELLGGAAAVMLARRSAAPMRADASSGDVPIPPQP
ncbi:lysylphosphatidylglycerol synthase domain-containing protein [Longimicrobium sp.]|uniref:lysylphosphatidylglycerol synthase domain-containing protein n=1 Tax=Longimicrobium sp. TaxID=2029185 RepID=UPI002F95545C